MWVKKMLVYKVISNLDAMIAGGDKWWKLEFQCVHLDLGDNFYWVWTMGYGFRHVLMVVFWAWEGVKMHQIKKFQKQQSSVVHWSPKSRCTHWNSNFHHLSPPAILAQNFQISVIFISNKQIIRKIKEWHHVSLTSNISYLGKNLFENVSRGW